MAYIAVEVHIYNMTPVLSGLVCSPTHIERLRDAAQFFNRPGVHWKTVWPCIVFALYGRLWHHGP